MREKGQKSIHFNGDEENIELILRTNISVNQVSVYVAVADLCKELSKDSEVAGELAANEDLESMEIPTELPMDDPHTNAELQGTCCKMMRINSNDFLKIRNYPNCAATPVCRLRKTR